MPTNAILEQRTTEATELRELFYAYEARAGHAAYAEIAHVIAAGLYAPSEAAWRAAKTAAVSRLATLALSAKVRQPERKGDVSRALLRLFKEAVEVIASAADVLDHSQN